MGYKASGASFDFKMVAILSGYDKREAELRSTLFSLVDIFSLGSLAARGQAVLAATVLVLAPSVQSARECPLSTTKSISSKAFGPTKQQPSIHPPGPLSSTCERCSLQRGPGVQGS